MNASQRSSSCGTDSVSSYIFNKLMAKRRPTQTSLLTVSADEDAVSTAPSRRSSACVSAVSHAKSRVSSISSVLSLAAETAGEKIINRNHESLISSGDLSEAGTSSVTPAAAAAAAAAVSARFTCPLCTRQLSEPRVLPCLHAFCTACLRDLNSVPSDDARSEIALWNGGSEAPFSAVHGSAPPSENQQNPTSATSSAGSGYESEDVGSDVWNPLSGRRNARIWSRSTEGSGVASRIIVCPTCGAEARIPLGGVLMFPLHHVLKHRMLLASLARDAAETVESVFCDLCSTNIQATMRCSDCLLSLCTFCSEAHMRQRRTAAHEILSLSEARRRGSRILREHLCPIHPNQETRFFCESCGQVACRDCCVTLHRDHRPPCELVSKVAQAYISEVRDALERARPLADNVNCVLNRLHMFEQRTQAKASSVQQEVDNHIDAWIEALEAHRRTLTMQVRKARETKLQAVRAQQRELKRRSGDVSLAVHFADELLTEGSEVEVMSTVTHLLRRLECCLSGEPATVKLVGSNSSSSSSAGERASLAETVVPVVPSMARVSDCLKFLPNEVSGRTNEGLPLYGVVTTQTISASHCRIDLDALSSCRQHRRAEVLLVTHDHANEPIGHGGADVTVEVRARHPTRRPLLAVNVTDRGDGTYLISFLPDAAGNYSMTVFVENKSIQGSPFLIYVRPLRPHSGIFHCCTFCSSNGNKEITCGCGTTMPGGYRGCGHGHSGHPGRRHWSCCGSVLESSECGRGTVSPYQFPL